MNSMPGGLPYTASTIATGPPAPADAASIDAPENTAENRRRLICRAPKASAPYDPRDFSGVAEMRITAIAVSGVDLVDLDRRSVSKTSIRVCVTIANWRYSGAAADEPARKGPKIVVAAMGSWSERRVLTVPVRASWPHSRADISLGKRGGSVLEMIRARFVPCVGRRKPDRDARAPARVTPDIPCRGKSASGRARDHNLRCELFKNPRQQYPHVRYRRRYFSQSTPSCATL